MAKSKQITAWVESTPGQLGRIAKALGDAKVNITGFSACTTGGESPIRLQVNSPAKAKKVLQGLGLRITEEEVLRLTLPDKPGVLGAVGQRLGQANVNVEYAFGSVAKGGKKADVVLGVSDLASAAKALRGL
ncbi:MAG: ACT domain-containing protein [Acidobacteria bacterium]|nr:ACT domain-containing protein [Acidobacteriota bacterium]